MARLPTPIMPLGIGGQAIALQAHKEFMDKQYCVYIMTNKYNTTLYTGVTSNLVKRACEHKEKLAEGFSKRYDIEKLVYFEVFEDVNVAIEREKSIKDGPRKKKVELIVGMNPSWDDLIKNL